MSVTHIVKQLRSLPYADMMLVVEEIRERIKDLTEQKIEAVVLAGILSRLSEGAVDIDAATQEEERVLKEIFRRKLNVSIVRHGTGWQVDIPSVPGAQVIGKELRSLFPMMLDQIITLHVLQK